MASIDLDGMARLIGGMEDVATYLPGIRAEFTTTLNRFDLPTDSPARLADVSAWADQELPGLRRRLALARSIEASSPTWSTGTVTIDESAISTLDPTQAQQAGADAAQALLNGSGAPDAALLAQIEQLQGDPYFAYGFASAVSPEQLAQIVTRLSGARLPLQQSMNAEENEKANAWYAPLLTSMSTTLATATYGTGDLALPSDYAQTWVKAITEDTPTDIWGDGSGTAMPDQAAALGLLLGSGGRFAPAFTTTVAEGVYTYERTAAEDHGGKVWYPRTSGATTAGAGVYDPATGAAYVDPMIGVMSALARQPECAARFLNPDGGGATAQERARYLIEERTWTQDDFDAIARVLDAGGTVWHTTGASPADQRASAWIASATVHHLAARDEGSSGRRIGEAGKDSLGHLLAAYVADIDVVAQGQDALSTPAVSSDGYTTASWLRDLPVGATFTKGTLNAVLSEVTIDDTAAAQLASAASAFNTARLDAAYAEYEADQAVGITGPLGSSARLIGYLTGNVEQGSIDAKKQVDERNAQFIGLASDVVDLIPTGGTIASFIAGQAKSAGKDQITDALTGNAAAAVATGQEEAEVTTRNLQIATAVAMADSRYLPDSVRLDAYGKVYPWFQDGATVEETLTDPQMRGLFIQWMNDDSGAIAGLLPDVSENFDQGRTLAMQ